MAPAGTLGSATLVQLVLYKHQHYLWGGTASRDTSCPATGVAGRESRGPAVKEREENKKNEQPKPRWNKHQLDL